MRTMDQTATARADAALAGSARTTDSSRTAESARSVLQSVQEAIQVSKRMVADYALLAVLDLRRAALQFAWLAGAAIAIGVLLVTAWLAGVTALVGWLVNSRDFSWPVAVLIAAGLNLVGAAVVAWRVKSAFLDMPFAATLRQLKAEQPGGDPS